MLLDRDKSTGDQSDGGLHGGDLGLKGVLLGLSAGDGGAGDLLGDGGDLAAGGVA